MTNSFNFNVVHPSWQACLTEALEKMDPNYLEKLYQTHDWLPGPKKIFSAFSLPVNKVRYVLFGESPYPRTQSANGYAFWDANVDTIWSATGFSKTVNRATSLRNILKMLLVAEGALPLNKTSQADIAQLKHEQFVQTNAELFSNFLNKGFLLLNASLVLRPTTSVRKDAIAWHPFIKHVLNFLLSQRPKVELILLGSIATIIDKLIEKHHIKKLYAEHPYNISFIQNDKILNFFKPLHLLNR